ncbi:hypothetical protein B296_00054539 [Ensete ventricosum]|uniref:Uncharacterized protein n=1 Tax=Ensete ventricosum TaxID=4639 RepID=A0A426XU25_ENSVE|nr:hypothetical protein B296_00054539 [Ensete ventricosum]
MRKKPVEKVLTEKKPKSKKSVEKKPAERKPVAEKKPVEKKPTEKMPAVEKKPPEKKPTEMKPATEKQMKKREKNKSLEMATTELRMMPRYREAVEPRRQAEKKNSITNTSINHKCFIVPNLSGVIAPAITNQIPDPYFKSIVNEVLVVGDERGDWIAPERGDLILLL